LDSCGPLTPEEWTEMRLHPELGYRLLRHIDYLRDASQIVLQHQEKWDGGGYPRGLQGERIHIGARCFHVADALDAITTDRPYRKAVPAPQVRDYLRTIAGTHLESRLVDLFLSTGPE